jgi:hypothetical protein
LFSIPTLPQRKPLEAGFKLINEFGYGLYEPGAGVQLVCPLSAHSGIETGLYYKIDAYNYYFFTSSSFYPVRSKEIFCYPFSTGSTQGC